MAGGFQSLPVARWVQDLGPGTVRVSGVLPEPVERNGLEVQPGPLLVELVFHGGSPARLEWVRVSGDARLNGRPVDGERIDDDLGMTEIISLVSRLADPDVEARAQPARVLDVRLSEGVRLAIDPHVVVTVSGSASGTAGSLSLTRPLVIGFGGDGVRVAHLGFGRLSRLASVRLHRLSLAPDGRVRLEGGAASPLNVAARGGFSTASATITHMVRRGERFRSLRQFLRLDEE
jgi:hypothetical protein